MAKLSFVFSYRNFARYLFGNCDSEQMTDAVVSERWLYNNIDEYVRSKGRHWPKFCFDQIKPSELGGNSALDFVAFKKNSDLYSVCMEAKMMIDDNRQWTEEILTDLVRLECLKENVNSKTKRLFFVAAQRRIFFKEWQKNDGFLSKVLPVPKYLGEIKWWGRIKKKLAMNKETKINFMRLGNDNVRGIFNKIKQRTNLDFPPYAKVKCITPCASSKYKTFNL
ncbi:hypothetical protein [Candidatus Uabimicrobium sp. HlEnr_7]|uniref:hypothetical protein n=1 Tax=Candidatus Uabimicrobium helgolandensis TaxID=3095367 RepID=UPI0035573405